MPSSITFSDGSSITYTYAADGTKLRSVHKIGSATTTTDYCGNVIYENNAAKLLLTEEGYVSLNDNKYHYYLKDHQGNNRVVINQSGSVEETNHYYPFGGVFAGTNIQPYKYNGKELDSKKGLNWYDYGARYYDAALGRFVAVDPLAEKYYLVTLYNYCLNNPVNAIDLGGYSTWVMNNNDGTYRVVGGDLTDKDRNIYVYNILDGKMIRGESIGMTTSTTSFYNSDSDGGKGRWMIGSIIDPNDKSGDNFLSEIIGKNPPMLNDYAMNARTGHKYDFKVTNGTNTPIPDINIYRGMPIGKNGKGQVIYTSARDIGNIAAGYIAGVNGMSWEASRTAFDAYQSKASGKLTMEGISTRNAEYYGWRMGYDQSPYEKLNNFKISMKDALKALFDKIRK